MRNTDWNDQAGLYAHVLLERTKRISTRLISGFQTLFDVDAQTRASYFREKGIQYARKGRYDKGAELLRTVVDTMPHDVESRLYLGLSYLKTGQQQDGLKVLESALELDPENMRTISILGTAYIQEGEHAKAIPLLERIISQQPDNHSLCYRLGMAYDKLKHFDQAIACFNSVLASQGDDPKILRSLSFACEQNGDKEAAMVHMKRAMELDELQTKQTLGAGQ